MTRLLLVTSNYPFTYTGGETMFVGPELPHLVRAGFQVSVAPLHALGERLPLPEGVALDLGLHHEMQRSAWRRGAAGLRWPGLGTELRRALRQGGAVGTARVLRWAAQAQATWAWLQGLPPQAGPALAYSYWRGGATLALARWAGQGPDRAALTRVHGFDLYAERFSPPFQPFTGVYDDLACIGTISEHGAAYLREAGVPASRLRLARLGTPAAAQARGGDGRPWQVLSCSAATPLKRVLLLAQALRELARDHPEQALAWTHLGAGPELPAVKALLAQAPPNLQVHLPGALAHAEVLRHYATQPVDLFVLLSRSEGLPVSVQEALAHGVPVLATAVGGTPEAVDATVGQLLPADPNPALVAQGLAALLWRSSPAQRHLRRLAARQRWAERFDADSNHAQWAHGLAELAATLNE